MERKQEEEKEMASYKKLHELLIKIRDNDLRSGISRGIRQVVANELASMGKDLMENEVNGSQVCKSFIKISGTLTDRL